jgi:A/G-specific adenine glycosylase
MYAQILAWFTQEGRSLPWREDYSPYSVWVSETMLCQTQVERVISRYLLWMQRFPDVSVLARVSLTELLQIWEGLGYYSRPRYMWETARKVVATFQGEFPRDYKTLRQLPGVGDYTACAILSIAYNLPYPAIDGNAKRVFARFLDLRIPIQTKEAYRYIFDAALSSIQQGEARFFNQAIMDLGALICTPRRPRCRLCPVRDFCLAFKHNTQEFRPVREKRLRQEVDATIVLFYHQGRVLIRKRPEKGFLAGLWEFPWKEGNFLGDIVADNSGVAPILVGTFRHTYCNRRVKASVFLVPTDEPVDTFSGDYRWEELGRLGEYPLSSFHRKAVTLFLRFLDNNPGGMHDEKQTLGVATFCDDGVSILCDVDGSGSGISL